MGRITISIPDDLEKRVMYFLSKNKTNYDGPSELYQELTKNFLEPGNKYYLTLAMLYLGYPAILLTLLLRVSVQTGDVTYNYISALITGLLLAGLYWFASKNKGKYRRK
jgi:hypothetical protein